jgi:hypothetical protein
MSQREEQRERTAGQRQQTFLEHCNLAAPNINIDVMKPLYIVFKLSDKLSSLGR